MALPTPQILLLLFVIASAALVAQLARHTDELASARGGRLLLLVGAFLMPLTAMAWGIQSNLERAKATEFCLSCHEMQPYGRSLYLDDAAAVPAAHFQNNRIPRESACYTCHQDYTMFGDVKDKIRGVRHVLAHFGGAPDRIELYHPYDSRNCLDCHEGGRSFGETHDVIGLSLPELAGGEVSCQTSGCHDSVHSARELRGKSFWTPPEAAP